MLIKKIFLLIPSITTISISLVSCATNNSQFGNSTNNNNNNGNDNKEPGNDIDPNMPLGWAKKTNTTNNDVKQYDIEYNKKHHFNYPIYDKDLVTLKAMNGQPKQQPGKDVTHPDYSLERYLTNQKHIEIAKQSYSVGFYNGVEKIGTSWILDYKLTNDNSYPITWFFGTNAHVLDDLKVKDDKLYPEKFGEWNNDKKAFRTLNTKAVSLWQLNDPKIDFDYGDNFSKSSEWKSIRIDLSNETPNNNETPNPITGHWSGYYVNNPKVKTIFMGYDFLTISPKDSSINEYSKNEEYADFAVFEVTFNSPEEAKSVTNDYANWEESKKFKYREDDLVNNTSLITKQIFTMGYPLVNATYDAYRTVSTNTNKYEYENKLNKGNGLSTSEYFNSWNDGYNGRFDAHITTPWFGYEYEYVDNNDNGDTPTRKTKYNSYGLTYGTNNGAMRAGSSGSMVIDENGYTIGIHFASDKDAASGGVQALYSKGFDYKGYYGNHFLPQYDLIRGGYKYQKGSYYDGLIGWYGKNKSFKTRLFPNGLEQRH